MLSETPTWRGPFEYRQDQAITKKGANVTHGRYTYSLRAASLAAMQKKKKPDIRGRFGFAVKMRREELEWTQEDLADKAGIHRTYLSDVERGSRNLSLLNIERLAAALGMSLSELFRVVDMQ